MIKERRYLVIPDTLVPNINFDEILITSPETLSYSIDTQLTYVKYEVTIAEENGQQIITGRPSIYSEIYPEYNKVEMQELLSTKEWNRMLLEPTGSL